MCVVTCQNHVIGRFRDHDITFYPLVVADALNASNASFSTSLYFSIILLFYTNMLFKITFKHSKNNRIIDIKVSYVIKKSFVRVKKKKKTTIITSIIFVFKN